MWQNGKDDVEARGPPTWQIQKTEATNRDKMRTPHSSLLSDSFCFFVSDCLRLSLSLSTDHHVRRRRQYPFRPFVLLPPLSFAHLCLVVRLLLISRPPSF